MLKANEREEEVLATRVPTPEAPSRDSSREVRALRILATILAVALLGLVGWTVYDQTRTSTTEISGDVQQVVDDYMDAWTNYDGETLSTLLTEDYRFGSWVADTNAAETTAFVDNLGFYDWRVESRGEPIMSGDGPWYVAEAQTVYGTTTPGGIDGISVLTINEDFDGALLVAEHIYVAAPDFGVTTSPD